MSNLRAMMFLAAPLLAAASGPPPGVAASGTIESRIVIDKVKSGPAPACMLHATIDPNGSAFDDLGPGIALYRKSQTGGTVALTLPPVAHGTLTTNGGTTLAAYDYLSVGTASLDFTKADSGTVTFIGGGNVLPNADIVPHFRSYKEIWRKGPQQVEVHVVFTLGGCKLPVIGTFQF